MSEAADRRVLDEAGGVRAMTWVMGIMLFLTVLVAALGLATLGARALLAHQLGGRATVQIVVADPVLRDAEAARALAALRASPAVRRAAPVGQAELTRLLQPWLGDDAGDPELPVPAMIDVELAGDADAVDAAVRRVAPDARLDRHEGWMTPVTRLMTTVAGLAAALVLLMGGASAAVAVLAARAGLETHRATIEVMHMLGSTDRQVARLFQRRITLDAGLGGVAGGAAALLVVLLVGRQLAGLGSQLLGGVSLSAADWIALAALPVMFVVLANAAARVAITRALRSTL